MTNGEKFKAVFGVNPCEDGGCIMQKMVCNTQDGVCNDCPCYDFWNEEYKAIDSNGVCSFYGFKEVK